MPRFHIPFQRRAAFRRRTKLRMGMSLLLVLLVIVLALPVYAVYRPPRLLIRYLSNQYSDVLWHVALPSSQKYIALTIDDAPSGETPAILSVLKANEATATLFVIGSQVGGRDDVLVDLVRNGNELGNHAMHDEPARSLPLSELEQQITRVDDMIERAYIAAKVDRTPQKFFRPGSGFFNDGMRELVSSLGYKLVLGDVYPHDPQVSWANLNAWHILSMSREGSIIICHDRRSWTVPMLEMVLPELKKQGYKVVTLSELLHVHEQGRKG